MVFNSFISESAVVGLSCVLWLWEGGRVGGWEGGFPMQSEEFSQACA